MSKKLLSSQRAVFDSFKTKETTLLTLPKTWLKVFIRQLNSQKESEDIKIPLFLGVTVK